ncbi:MAG: ATP-binding protein [Chloroflexota bacterium]
MQIYLIATNLFSIVALLLGLGPLAGQRRRRRLWPLFLLAISRSVILLLALLTFERGQVVVASLMSALEVFSTFCLVWILSDPTAQLPAPWSSLRRWGTGGALLLSFLSLWPAWPVPFQLHSLIIAIFSPLLLILSRRQRRWVYLTPPLTLAVANFFSLFDLTGLSWLVNMLAYALLIYAVHQSHLQAYDEMYRDRQQESETLALDAITLSQEQRRWLDAARSLSAVPDLNRSMEHIAEVMARVLHVDQSAVVMLDVNAIGQAQLVTFYSAEQPFLVTGRDEVTFALADYPLLVRAIEERQQLLLPRQNLNGLDSLYALWYEDRAGPTLIQPLSITGQPVGVLVLGNPITRRPIYDNDARLCQSLAIQIAAMVEYRRRYIQLEMLAHEAIATPMPEQPRLPASPLQPPVIRQSVEMEAYEALFEAIGDGVVVSDNVGRIKWVNNAAEHILGKAKQVLIGQPIGAIYGQIDSGEPIEDLVVAFSRRNHPLPTFIETEDRAIQGRLMPWRNREREWLGIIAVFRDVTREVKADRARNDFIAALSHELRSPLTSIKGYMELMTNGLMEEYSPEKLRVYQIINSSAERMKQVLDNAIQISAQTRRQVLPRFEEIDPQKIIAEALREITPLAQVRELELSQEIKTGLPLLAADARHLRRILDNLLSNACRFTPPGGRVTLRAWVQAEREANQTRDHLLLAVADNGIGIPPGEIKRIFDPFYQVEHQDQSIESGMGMGLAVVKELVQLHNGRVWVESAPGQGSIFQVALPLTQEY